MRSSVPRGGWYALFRVIGHDRNKTLVGSDGSYYQVQVGKRWDGRVSRRWHSSSSEQCNVTAGGKRNATTA